jgi:betaine-aldehyde dehydrogenase
VISAITAREYQNLIDGNWVAAADGDTFERISPAHDVVVGRYPRAGVEDLNRAVAAARRAFDEGPWPTMPGVERARILNRVAEAIRANADDLAYARRSRAASP